jgi:predicted nuclease of predicted toxin-antitoxin system
MNLLIDMNLSPDWVTVLVQAGHTATHWSSVGSPQAKDREILTWARQRQQVVFTHDLDFGAILAATDAESPSVLQVRTAEPTPDHCGCIVLATLTRHAGALASGALISVDEIRARVRILPLKRREYGAVQPPA